MEYYKGSLYLWGGTNNEYNRLYTYDLDAEIWSVIDISYMKVKLTQHNGICIYKDNLYAIAGFDPVDSIKVESVFKINLESGNYEVEEIPIINKEMGDGSFGYDCKDNMMYIFGGYSKTGDRNSLVSIDLEEPLLNFTALSKQINTPIARHGHAMEVYNDELYIYGGINSGIK